MYKHGAFYIYCMWFMKTLKSRSYMDPQINLSLESHVLEALLGWSFALTDVYRTQLYSVPYRSLDQLLCSFRPYSTEMLRTKAFKIYSLTLSKKN